MKSLLLKSLLFPLSILTFFNQCNNPSKQSHQIANEGFDTSSLDKSFRPQDDFDSFANGGWKKRNPIPSTEGSWGAFGILDKENTEVKLKGIIDEVCKNKKNKPNSDEQKIADMYRAFMDTVTIENLALSPLQTYITQIENIKTLDEWIATSGELQKIGVPSVIGIYVDADDRNSTMNAVKFVQGGLSLGEKSFYSGNDERMLNIRQEFVKHIDKFVALTGNIFINPGPTILDFEKKLAAIQLSNVELRDPLKTYNKIALKDLKKHSGKLDWSVFTKKQDVVTDTIIVQNLNYYQNLSKLLNATSVETLKIYSFYQLIINYSTYLPKQFKDERFHFYGEIKSGIKEQKKRDIQAISITESLGDGNILGRLYTKQYFPESSKQKVSEMIENVRAVYGERIAQFALDER
jgi:putative endopeptidase